jgi:xanthine dehydrogenase accessory factor
MRPVALVKGAGDLATGVALTLARAEFSVVMTETPRPTVVRRAVAFAEAVYEGRACVEGLEAVLVASLREIPSALANGNVAIIVDPSASILAHLVPDLLVDAIVAKRNLGTRITDARAVVGLGPGFFAGRDVHAVVETMRGPTLGDVIMHGEALADTGVPAERNGFGKERVLRSPGQGPFVPLKRIGDRVRRGEPVGLVGDLPVLSELDGVLRGLLHHGLRVEAGFKLGDVEPGSEPCECDQVSDKALTIGQGVVKAARILLDSDRGRNSNLVWRLSSAG